MRYMPWGILLAGILGSGTGSGATAQAGFYTPGDRFVQSGFVRSGGLNGNDGILQSGQVGTISVFQSQSDVTAVIGAAGHALPGYGERRRPLGEPGLPGGFGDGVLTASQDASPSLPTAQAQITAAAGDGNRGMSRGSAVGSGGFPHAIGAATGASAIKIGPVTGAGVPHPSETILKAEPGITRPVVGTTVADFLSNPIDADDDGSSTDDLTDDLNWGTPAEPVTGPILTNPQITPVIGVAVPPEGGSDPDVADIVPIGDLGDLIPPIDSGWNGPPFVSHPAIDALNGEQPGFNGGPAVTPPVTSAVTASAPEPTSLALFGVGAVLLGAYRRRRQ